MGQREYVLCLGNCEGSLEDVFAKFYSNTLKIVVCIICWHCVDLVALFGHDDKND